MTNDEIRIIMVCVGFVDCISQGIRDPYFAGVAKLADASDLGSGADRRMGSSPFARIYYDLR